MSKSNWSNYLNLKYREGLSHGVLVNIAGAKCIHYDIWIMEHMFDPRWFVYVERRRGGRRLLGAGAWEVFTDSGKQAAMDFDMKTCLPRDLYNGRVSKAGMTDALEAVLFELVDTIQRDRPKGFLPPSVKVHAIGRVNIPDTLDGIINAYAGSGRQSRDMAKLAVEPSRRALARRGAIPGNQGGARRRNMDSGLSARERQILRTLDKLINGETR